ncbi:MAG: hypothetical protein CL676_13415 [Bdellovibrionaceae bacterium]|nr:hypothetical protein [Pseudobdellovibrionaceae bacterium]|tara:strand:+ start:233 stop:787 length:555 start_codon:yes stop_codon:yes gene_type:complete
MQKTFLILFIGLFSSVGCAHYQSGIGSFRGPGEMSRSPSSSNSVYYSPRNIGDFSLTWPVEDVSISQPFKPRRNRSHQGLDLRGPKNTPIVAAHPGRVIYVGRGFRGYGKMVMIEYNNRWASLYAHLNSFEVKQGQYVRMGDVIGRMGRTGRATGVHLHFELLKNKLPVNPMSYLPDLSRMAKR